MTRRRRRLLIQPLDLAERVSDDVSDISFGIESVPLNMPTRTLNLNERVTFRFINSDPIPLQEVDLSQRCEGVPVTFYVPNETSVEIYNAAIEAVEEYLPFPSIDLSASPEDYYTEVQLWHEEVGKLYRQYLTMAEEANVTRVSDENILPDPD
jgi:hypothetical protein